MDWTDVVSETSELYRERYHAANKLLFAYEEPSRLPAKEVRRISDALRECLDETELIERLTLRNQQEKESFLACSRLRVGVSLPRGKHSTIATISYFISCFVAHKMID